MWWRYRNEDTPSNKGAHKVGKPYYVHLMAVCVKAQTESNNTKDEEGWLTKNGTIDNMEKKD